MRNNTEFYFLSKQANKRKKKLRNSSVDTKLSRKKSLQLNTNTLLKCKEEIMWWPTIRKTIKFLSKASYEQTLDKSVHCFYSDIHWNVSLKKNELKEIWHTPIHYSLIIDLSANKLCSIIMSTSLLVYCGLLTFYVRRDIC